MDFTGRLNRTLKKKGISGSRLAKELGIAETAVRSWRTGKTEPRGDNLIKLADYLGVTPAWLKFGDKRYSSEVMAMARMIERYLKKHPVEKERIWKMIEVMTES